MEASQCEAPNEILYFLDKNLIESMTALLSWWVDGKLS